MNLRKQIRFYLDNRGITLSHLARLSGVRQSTLNEWLNGNVQNPSITQINKVAKALGVTLENLCFGDGAEFSKEKSLESILSDEWLSGLFEIKIRRVKERGKQ